MNYFIIFLLVIIIFTYLSDKKILDTKKIDESVKNLDEKIINIYNDMIVITINSRIKDDIAELKKHIMLKNKDENKRYILLKDERIILTKDTKELLIANYINTKECVTGFIMSYEYNYMKVGMLKELINEFWNIIINYLNIFIKSNINKYGVIILKKSQVEGFDDKEKIVTFSACERVRVSLKDVSKRDVIEKINSVYKTSLNSIIRAGLMVLLGVSVTSNLIYAVFNLGIIDIIIAIILYWNYTYVLKYMYNAIGRYKMITRYLFPIFLASYLLIKLTNIVIRKIEHKAL